MPTRARALWALGTALALAGCTSSPAEGQFDCSDETDCPDDWVCNPDDNHCYSSVEEFPAADGDSDADGDGDSDTDSDSDSDTGSDGDSDTGAPCIGSNIIEGPGSHTGDSSAYATNYQLSATAECWLNLNYYTLAPEEVWRADIPAGQTLQVTVSDIDFGGGCAAAVYMVTSCEEDTSDSTMCGGPTSGVCLGDLTCLVAHGGTGQVLIEHANDGASPLRVYVLVDGNLSCAGTYTIEFDFF